MRASPLLLLLVASAIACGDDMSVPDTGTSTPDANIGMPGAAEAPMPPAPRSDACPSGWVVVDDDGHSYCAGWPSPTPTCDPSEALIPGAGCVSIGAACPSSDFPADAPAGALFVRPGGTGDGTRDDPLGSLSDALALAPPTVVLSRGSHDIGTIRIDAATAVIGSCVPGTELLGSLAIGAGGVTVENLSIEDVSGSAVTIEGAGDAALTHVVVSATAAAAIETRGALSVADAKIDGGLLVAAGTTGLTRVGFVGGPSSSDDEFPSGALDVTGGAVDAEAVSFSGDPHGAVRVAGGNATIRQLMVESAGGFGVVVANEASQARIEDGVIRDIDHPSYRYVVGVRVVAGAAIAARLVIARTERYGVQLKSEGTATMEDLLVLDTQPRAEDGRQGMGVRVDEGSSLTLSRARIGGSRCAGIRASEGGSIDVQDVVVRETVGEVPTGEGGYGLRSDTLGSIVGRRILVESSRHAGVLIDTQSHMILEDLTVRDTASRERTMVGGHGVHVGVNSSVELTRAAIEGSREAGISLDGAGSSMTLYDVAIRDTESSELSGRFGGGLSVSGGTLDAHRISIERAKYVGLYVGEGATATLTDLALSEVTAQGCADDACAAEPFGIGLGAFNAGTLSVDRFTVRDSTLCGVMVGPSADLLLSGGQVTGALIGACIQASPFDVSRLTSDVMYSDNQQNLDTTALPVPEAAPRIMD